MTVPPPMPPSGSLSSFIQVAKPFIFEKTIQECFAATGADPIREDSNRLQGVTWIDNVRKALQLYEFFVDTPSRNLLLTIRDRPVRTFNTACIYYHKFRLVHSEQEYNYAVLEHYL